jgi:hypothetical protein
VVASVGQPNTCLAFVAPAISGADESAPKHDCQDKQTRRQRRNQACDKPMIRFHPPPPPHDVHESIVFLAVTNSGLLHPTYAECIAVESPRLISCTQRILTSCIWLPLTRLGQSCHYVTLQRHSGAAGTKILTIPAAPLGRAPCCDGSLDAAACCWHSAAR